MNYMMWVVSIKYMELHSQSTNLFEESRLYLLEIIMPLYDGFYFITEGRINTNDLISIYGELTLQ